MSIWNVYERAIKCRVFEECAFKAIKDGHIKVPTYLSAGQEFISSSIAHMYEKAGIKPLVFPQHRCHSIYLNFGGDIDALIDELLGFHTGCAGGRGGSASIHSPENNIFGHDGLMGSNVPIGTGACYASKHPTVVFIGDAAAEEDYALAAYGWAATKNLPILFVVEDNNLSILTEKNVRRSWNVHEVARAFGLKSYETNDDPTNILNCDLLSGPSLINVNTTRLYWHAGAGQDGEPSDRLSDLFKITLVDYNAAKKEMEARWESRLEKLLNQ